MTMHIVFKQDKDGYKTGWAGYIERSLARQFCKNGIAIPYQQHLDKLYDAEQVEIEEKKKAKVEKDKADAKAKAEKDKVAADKKADVPSVQTVTESPIKEVIPATPVKKVSKRKKAVKK